MNTAQATSPSNPATTPHYRLYPRRMHAVLEIPELATIICQYCQDDEPATLVALAATCRGMYGPAMDLIWRELDDFSPLIKCLPSHLWREVRRTDRDREFVTLELTDEPTPAQWGDTFRHAERVRRISWTQHHTLGSGATYEISWQALSLFGRWLRRRGPGQRVVPLLKNLRVLQVDVYERNGKYQVSEGAAYVAGQALREMYWHCYSDAFGFATDNVVDVSRALQMVPLMSPALAVLSFCDERLHGKTDPSSGLSFVLGQLAQLRSYTSTLTLTNYDVTHLAKMSKLTHLSVSFLGDKPTLPPPPPAVISSAFTLLDSLKLNVKDLANATAFLNILGDSTRLHKLIVQTSMSNNEHAFDTCFKAIAKHKSLEELSIVVNSVQPLMGPFITHTVINSDTLSILYDLPDIRVFIINALDNARFETDLDDRAIKNMALKWPRLRKLTIVQGSSSSRGMRLASAKTTLLSLMHLRTHCPYLSNLSISLDTRTYNLETLQAMSAPGGTGSELRRLHIGSRSTPVANPELAASLVRGFFPNLASVHDGIDVRWGEASDWQEVSAILRRLRKDVEKTEIGEE